MIAIFHVGEWVGGAVGLVGLLGAIWRAAVRVSRLVEANLAAIAANTRENKALAAQVNDLAVEQERVKSLLTDRVVPKVEHIQQTVDGQE